MNRIEKLKLKAINEANIRILEEGDIEYGTEGKRNNWINDELRGKTIKLKKTAFSKGSEWYLADRNRKEGYDFKWNIDAVKFTDGVKWSEFNKKGQLYVMFDVNLWGNQPDEEKNTSLPGDNHLLGYGDGFPGVAGLIVNQNGELKRFSASETDDKTKSMPGDVDMTNIVTINDLGGKELYKKIFADRRNNMDLG